MSQSGIKYVGVDGCPDGWVAVGLGDGDEPEIKVCGKFGDLLTHFADACIVLVDMLIGLREDGPLCYRACDNEARCLLRERKGSVFQVPSRQYLDEAARNSWWSHNDYDAANKWSKRVFEGGISKQAFGITKKIREIDKILKSRDKDASPKVREVHPEVCFWALNGKKPMSNGKKGNAGAGFRERLEVAQRFVRNAQGVLDKVRDCGYLKKQVADDDVLDALAAAITAKIGCRQGGFKTLPENPPTDSKGLPMEMVYAIP